MVGLNFGVSPDVRKSPRKEREENMADILKDNVQTYVRKLIDKNLESINNKDIFSLDKRKLSKGEQRNEQKGPIWSCPSNSK